MMALPRVCVLGRSFLSRGSPTRIASSVFSKTKIAVALPQRQFTSKSWLLQEAVQDQAASAQSAVPLEQIPEFQRSKNARSVVVMNFPKRISRAAVEALFKDNGLEIADIELRIDRFTFFNDRHAFIELASEEQARKAVELLNENENLGIKVYVRQLRPDYAWNINGNKKDDLGYLVIANEAGLTAATQPILDGRRIVFSVKPPAWADLQAPIGIRNEANREIVKRTLAPFGLESIGRISPNWGDMKQTPRFLCFADMKTKQGAEEAMSTLHDTDVQGLKIWLTQHQMAPWRAYQLGVADKAKLKLLQEEGVAPPPEEIDEERYSTPFVQKPPKGQRSRRG